ncbi:restriction endonuclease subunit S [Vitreoscilla filiformis]|nr:restriction endonuclease subunit S [Vitreoscilla filiformis]
MSKILYKLRDIAPAAQAENFEIEGNVWILNLDKIEPNTGVLLSKDFVSIAEIGNSTNRFDDGNVLYSKLRPYLNKVYLPDSPGFCTSELVPMRPNQNIVTREYLAAYLKSPYFLQWVSQQVDGAKMPRVSMRILWEHEVALPSLIEQRRITAVLSKADSLRSKRQEAMRLADEFLRAAYVEIFGDPVENPYQWPSLELSELVESTKLGLVRSAEEFGWNLPTPYLRMDAISNDGKILHKKIQGTNASPEEIAQFELRRGDLLFNTRNSRELVGKTAIWDGGDGVIFNNNIMRLRLNSMIAPEVIAMQFQLPLLKQELETRKSGTTSVFAVYYKDLKTLPIQIPSKDRQQKYVQVTKKVARYMAKMQEMASNAEQLTQSLSHKFFG